MVSQRVEHGWTTFTFRMAAAAAAKSLQSCPTLCDLIDGSPPGSPIPGILQARTLEWVAISFSNAWKWKVKVKSLSRVWLFSDPMDCSPPGSSWDFPGKSWDPCNCNFLSTPQAEHSGSERCSVMFGLYPQWSPIAVLWVEADHSSLGNPNGQVRPSTGA